MAVTVQKVVILCDGLSWNTWAPWEALNCLVVEESCVSFIRGHFKEIFTLLAISLLPVLLCLFSNWNILLSSHFMVWRTKSIANHWWNHTTMSMSHSWWAQESRLSLEDFMAVKAGRGLKRILGRLSFFFLFFLCNVLVFLFPSLTVLLLLHWYLFSQSFLFLLFLPCLLLFVHTYLGVAVYMERKRWAMPWHRGPEDNWDSATAFSGRKEGREAVFHPSHPLLVD